MTHSPEQYIEKVLETTKNKYLSYLLRKKYAFDKADWKFIETEFCSALQNLVKDMKEKVEAQREDMPANVEHPHYNFFVSEWNAREHILTGVLSLLDQYVPDNKKIL